jgi:hypothetical protein
MRQLFVPACVCFMTWSGATGSDPRLSLDEFFGTAKAGTKVHAQHAPVDNVEPGSIEGGSAEPVRAEIPVDLSAAEIAREAPGTETPAAQFTEQRIPLPPIAKPVVHRTREEVCETLTQAAESNHLPVPFFINLLFQESRFQPEVVSSAGAQGVAQFMPETAASMGLENPFDPLQAIPASARLLRELVSQFGNVGLAAAAYNAGPKRIQDWLQKKGKLPEETKGYVKSITGRPAENWTAASAEHPGQRLPRHAPCQESAGLYAANGPATIPLPAPSPQRLAEMAPTLVAQNEGHKTPSKHRIASIEKNTNAKTADTAKPVTAKPVVLASADASLPVSSAASVKIAKHGARVTAVIDMSKPAAKPAIQQLAARKQHNPDKPKYDKVAQR